MTGQSPASVTVHITVTPVVGNVLTTGLWCDVCALPSAVDVEVHGLWSGGVVPLGICTACTECPSRRGYTP